MPVFAAYTNTWPLCLGLIGFLVPLAGLTHSCVFPGNNARPLLWVSLLFWRVFMSVITALIDSPCLHPPRESAQTDCAVRGSDGNA